VPKESLDGERRPDGILASRAPAIRWTQQRGGCLGAEKAFRSRTQPVDERRCWPELGLILQFELANDLCGQLG
jgi:hypothetical protein